MQLCPVQALVQQFVTVFSANLIRVGVVVTRLDVQRAGDRFPCRWRALGNVLQRDMQAGQRDLTRGLPHLDSSMGCVVRLGCATAKQFGGSRVEIGAEGEAIAAQFAGLLDLFDALAQCGLAEGGETVELKVVERVDPVVGEGVLAQVTTLGREREVAAVQLSRVHADAIDSGLVGGVCCGRQLSLVLVGCHETLPHGMVWQHWATTTGA